MHAKSINCLKGEEAWTVCRFKGGGGEGLSKKGGVYTPMHDMITFLFFCFFSLQILYFYFYVNFSSFFSLDPPLFY